MFELVLKPKRKSGTLEMMEEASKLLYSRVSLSLPLRASTNQWSWVEAASSMAEPKGLKEGSEGVKRKRRKLRSMR